jgi:hypothetical protein
MDRRPHCIIACLLSAGLLLGGCIVTVEPDGPGGGPRGTTITIRVVNSTTTTIDPDIYIATEAATVEQLFVPQRKYTAFGVGKLGVLAPASSDEFTLPCDRVAVLGTLGGKFGDDLTMPDGTGRQIVLTRDLNLFCNGRVTFTYSGSRGAYTTSFTVSP